jgi:ADP-heptose:LPS heptosyltransferase
VVRGLKEQVEGAQVHYLTKRQFLPVISANPNIDKIHLFDKSLSKLIAGLKQEEFDYIIDLHKNLRSLRVKSRLKRFYFSVNKLNLRKWLLVNLKIDKLPPKHIVDRYLDTVRSFSVGNDDRGLDYFIPNSEEVDLAKEFPTVAKTYIAVAVGGGHETKQIPADKLIEVINTIGTDVVLLGSKADSRKADVIVKTTSNKRVHDLTGKLSINQSASFVRQAMIVLTPDTGIMHMAAAFRVPVLSVWGNTVPAFGMYPYLPAGNSEIFEVKGLKCRPCSKIGFRECPKKHFKCMREQDYTQISNKIKFILNQ